MNMSMLDVLKCAILATIFLVNEQEANAEEQCLVNTFEEIEDAVKNCTNIILDSISVPGGKTLNINLTEGSSLTLRGNTSFSFYEWVGPLIKISGSNIRVKGEEGSVLDGQGSLWWDGQGSWGNTTKPKFFRIIATNATFDGINIRNCPIACTGISSSKNVTIKNWKIDNLDGDEGVAPANKFGHNTDGFGISNSENIIIEDSIVYNQDDCVVFNSGKNIIVRNLFCHGSHGISVSVRGGGTVEDVLVENSIVTMSENGIHIKTRVDSGEGLIRNILYRNITLLDSKFYGINVQQNYRDLPAGQPQDGPPENSIPIHNLTMENIYGNVLSGGVPVFVLCADEGCFDWKWEGVTIYGALDDNCTNYTPEGYNC